MSSAAASRLSEIADRQRALAAEQARLAEEAAALAAQEREAAVVEAIELYPGSLYARASALASDLRSYAGNGWLRERHLVVLASSEPPKRRAWHRLLRSRNGETIGWRWLYEVCSRSRLRLQTTPCESECETEVSDGDSGFFEGLEEGAGSGN